LTSACGSVKQLFDTLFEQATVSLMKTPDQLEVDGKFILKDAGVEFDSGAKGFALMCEGLVKCLEGCPYDLPVSDGWFGLASCPCQTIFNANAGKAF
jgi:dihydroxyacetone kinase-like predicted kinase